MNPYNPCKANTDIEGSPMLAHLQYQDSDMDIGKLRKTVIKCQHHCETNIYLL